MSEVHPLQEVYDRALSQLLKGKGVRHGGNSIPFLEQRWVKIAKVHGIGFLTGQAAKKLDEAMGKIDDETAFETELLGAMNYIAMAVLFYNQVDT